MMMLQKPVRRELPITFDRRRWSATMHPWGLEFRAKRERTTYTITWESVMHRMMEQHVEAARREKAKATAARRKS